MLNDMSYVMSFVMMVEAGSGPLFPHIEKIIGSLCKMRLERDYEREEMLGSIGECGLMNPIKVKKAEGGYLIFAGHRRLDCASVDIRRNRKGNKVTIEFS